MPALRRSAPALWASALVLVLALAGCSAAPVPTAAPTADPSAAASAEPAPVAVSIEMPELGPVPASDPPLTEAESEAARLAGAEEAWRRVLDRFPEAVRPEAAFAGYSTGADRVDAMRACFDAAGLAVDEGRDRDGNVVSVGTSTSTSAEAVAQFACQSAHPIKVEFAGPNEAERGWMYDYLLGFSVPCYAANGLESAPPPTREDFVQNWPNQGWWPAGPTMTADPDWEAAVAAACPDVDSAMRGAQP